MKFNAINHLTPIQQQVDSWINNIGIRYFSELTNLSNLIEETGEVARLIGREYGEQSFKKGEEPECIKTAIADELSDIGDVNVWCCEDPITKVATGALKLAEAMPDEQYTSIN